MKIAIDGPSGAGKSTAAKLISNKLGITYLDTGAMYRAVGLKVKRLGLAIAESEEMNRLLDSTSIEITCKGTTKILLDGEDVSQAIREHDISKYASDVSALKSVRLKLVDMQRAIAASSDCVLDGRDIGTYVFPDAEYKFYLTATVDVRTARRTAELRGKGFDAEFETVKKDILQRDYNDTHRDFAPLKKAGDAIEIDCSSLTAEETVNTMLSYINAGAKKD